MDEQVQMISGVPNLLSHDKIYSIIVGGTTFSLSGLSLSSDGPSYFTEYFKQFDQLQKTPALVVDRSPDVFVLISKHLQGYDVPVSSQEEFCSLYSDAMYYSLHKLIKRLHDSEAFISIGGRTFHIPTTLFSAPGDKNNFLALSFAVFFTRPSDDLDTTNPINSGSNQMFRPPVLKLPSLPTRSGDLFEKLVKIALGEPIETVIKGGIIERNAERNALINECRYYRFLEIEQRLIPCKVTQHEITINLRYIKSTGISNDINSDLIKYKRPFIDKIIRTLVLQLSIENENEYPIAEFDQDSNKLIFLDNDIIKKLTSLFEIDISIVNAENRMYPIQNENSNILNQQIPFAKGLKRRRSLLLSKLLVHIQKNPFKFLILLYKEYDAENKPREFLPEFI